MNYARHYDFLMARARGRVLGGYTERHHVVPKCLGGWHEADNRVDLTAREHFVAHQLLVKMYPTSRGLAFAAFKMSIRKRIGSRRYAWLRERMAITQSACSTNREGARQRCISDNPMRRPEVVVRRDMTGAGNPMRNPVILAKVRGDHHASKRPEVRAKISAAHIGKKNSPEAIEKMRRSHIGMNAGDKNPMKRPEVRAKHSARQKGVPKHPDAVRNAALARTGVKFGIIACPNCGKEGGKNAIRRWHFDKCKVQPHLAAV